MLRAARVGIAGALVGATLVLAGAPAMAADHHTLVVLPGTGTISAAVSAAHAGDTLQLKAGTYFDSVLVGRVDSSGNILPKSLTIRGVGASTVIKPPPTFTNPCSSAGAVEGLCITGQLDSSGNPVVSNPVHDVHISDLRTTGFSDSGIIGFNTEGLDVENVRSDHNGGYGIARFVSTNTLFADNSVSYNGEAGLYMGDSPNANSVVKDNTADHNGFGIFLRDSTKIVAQGNTSWGNCVGILALNTGQGGTGATGAGFHTIQNNTVTANDQACPSSEGPPTSGIGIALVGVLGTKVIGNDVTANQPSGPSLASGGVVIVSGATSPSSNNLVKGNTIENNQPQDVFWDQMGTGNTVVHNDCETAVPNNLGWCA